MASLAVASSHAIYNTGVRHHIDALSIAPSSGSSDAMAALATSSLTGDSWDGCLVVLDRVGSADISRNGSSPAVQPANVVARAQTQNGISSIAWLSSSNNSLLATGDDRGDLTVWQLEQSSSTCSVVSTFGEHTQPITSLAAAAHANGPSSTMAAAPAGRIATTSLDGTAKAWNAAVAGGCLATLEHLPLHATWGEVPVHSSCWLDDGAQLLATGASDGVVRLWDVRQASPAATRCAPHTAPILCLSRGAGVESPQLLAGAESGSLLLLDARKLDAPVASVAQVAGDVALSTLCLAPLAQAAMTPVVAAGLEDGCVALLDPRDLHLLTTARPNEARVGGLGWAANNVLLSGGWDRRLVRIEFGPAAQ